MAQSPRTTGIFAAPGNAGTARIGQNLDIGASDIGSMVAAVEDIGIELVVVGPEAPLAAGMVDRFQEIGIPVFGPTQQAAEIESSKVFAKDLLCTYDIPCGHSITFSDFIKAKAYIEQQGPPVVIKADGLAAGKGVVVAGTIQQALEALSDFMESKKLGEAGNRVIIEEHLSGREMSAFVFTDGEKVIPLAYACDYKRIYDGNSGPNTGGMGSYSPPSFLTPVLAEQVQQEIMQPTVRAMAQEGRTYRGLLYGGLMITGEGPKVIEFNARLGDPETQVVLPLLKTDMVDIILATINGDLDKVNVECHEGACVGVVMASGGYPGSYETGFPITGLDDVDDGILVFHAGTKPGSKPGEVLTSGGRVLTVAARGETLNRAREKVYDNISRIHFKDCYYRKDIALLEEAGK